jgi:T4 bacteriophage base plate protein
MSNLPKLDYPIYSIDIPSLKKSYKFRPFLVKEEKLLLMAKESGTDADILGAIKQIVNNCSLDPKLDINKLAVFDLEYVFLKLRSVSVDNKISVSYKDNEDEKVYQFDINLDEVKIVFPEKIDNVIKITAKSGLTMKYPSASLYEDKDFLNLDKDYLFQLITRCIENIYFEEDVYPAKDYKIEELNSFLENLDIKSFQKIQEFLLNVPKMEYKIEYKNSLEHDREIVLSSLNDFFTWR